MTLRPGSFEELSRCLAETREGVVDSVDLSAFNRVAEHFPEDMTATAQTGLRLRDFQAALRKAGQWLPIDPPDDSIMLAELLQNDLSGPRRCGYGTIRDYALGFTVMLSDGTLIKSGGKVVKNVAGYDLCKLFIGSRSALGVIVEATFKLRPLPEAERFLQKQCASLAEAGALLQSILNSPMQPVVLDLHNQTGSFTAVAGFDGAAEDVDAQSAEAARLGLNEPAGMSHERSFRASAGEPVRKISVLPSRLIETLKTFGGKPFVARAANGVIYSRSASPAPSSSAPRELIARVKSAFDPKNIFPQPAP